MYKVRLCPHWMFIGVYLLVGTSCGWAAPAEAPNKYVPEPNVKADIAAILQQPEPAAEFDVGIDPVLQVKVSFEVKHYPVHDLLADLQRQTGVQLMKADAAAVNARVTAYVRDVTLADVMKNLARLYGVVWSKSNDGKYIMQASDLSEVEQGLLQLGGPHWQYQTRRPPISTRWEKEILPHIEDVNALRSREGVPFTILPQDLQSRLRQQCEGFSLINFVAAHLKASPTLLSSYKFEVRPRISRQTLNNQLLIPVLIVSLQSKTGMGSADVAVVSAVYPPTIVR